MSLARQNAALCGNGNVGCWHGIQRCSVHISVISRSPVASAPIQVTLNSLNEYFAQNSPKPLAAFPYMINVKTTIKDFERNQSCQKDCHHSKERNRQSLDIRTSDSLVYRLNFSVLNVMFYLVIDYMVLNAVSNSISFTSQRPVHLYMLSWSSCTQYSAQHSF